MRRRIGVHGNGMVARQVDEMTGDPTVWDRMHRRRSGHVEIGRIQGRGKEESEVRNKKYEKKNRMRQGSKGTHLRSMGR